MAYQPTNSIFLSHQTSQQYFQSWLINQTSSNQHGVEPEDIQQNESLPCALLLSPSFFLAKPSDTSPAKHGEIFLGFICVNLVIFIIAIIFSRAGFGTSHSFGTIYSISIPLHKVNVSVRIEKPVVHVNQCWAITVILCFTFTCLVRMPSEVLLTIWMIDFCLAPRTSIAITCVCAQAGLETGSATISP